MSSQLGTTKTATIEQTALREELNVLKRKESDLWHRIAENLERQEVVRSQLQRLSKEIEYETGRA